MQYRHISQGNIYSFNYKYLPYYQATINIKQNSLLHSGKLYREVKGRKNMCTLCQFFGLQLKALVGIIYFANYGFVFLSIIQSIVSLVGWCQTQIKYVLGQLTNFVLGSLINFFLYIESLIKQKNYIEYFLLCLSPSNIFIFCFGS